MEFVAWSDEAAANNISNKFESRKRIPGVIGAIDCTHITIKAPQLNKESYLNRKKNYSLVIQAVVDADKKFIDICCGEPGSLDDSRVLRRSDLYRKATTDTCFITIHLY